MRTPLRIVSSVLLLACLTRPAPAATPRVLRHAALPPRSGVLLLVLAPDASPLASPARTWRARNARLAAACDRLALARPERLSRGTARAGRPEFLALRSDDPAFDPYAAAVSLRGLPGVLAAAPDLRLSLDLVPNDPNLSLQWHLGTSVAAVRARPAWDISTGSPNVVIGVLDTGVDTGHPDLASKIRHNPGEIPANGVDDDGNGYVDDITGWDFGNGDANPDPEPVFDTVTGVDVGWHGTFVAGLAAAASNNATGIAGVAWGCEVLPLKVSDTAGDIPLSAVTAAVLYAADNGVDVLNLSLGSPDTTAAAFFQPLMDLATAAGVVCVASAGNDGTDALEYPAACAGVLSVAATDASNNRASFSNWGPSVDIAAPGESMWSSIARNYVYDDFSLVFFEVLWGYDDVHPYMYGDGTSFSAPVVAGAAALVRSQFPALGVAAVVQQLVVNGDARLYDNPIGPRLDIQRALANPLAVPPGARSATLVFAPASPNPSAGAVRFSFALPATSRVRLDVLDAQGRRTCAVLDATLPAGEHALAWDGRGPDGRAVAAGLYFAVLRAGDTRLTRRLAVVH